MIEQGRRKIQHLFFILMLWLICNFGLTNCSQVAEYKYTFDLDENQAKDLSEINGKKVYNENFTGQVLDEFIIKQPKQIENVVQIIANYKTQNIGNDSIVTEIDNNELLSAPQIEKVWIEANIWSIKKNSLLYVLGMQKDNGQKQKQKQKKSIVSAAYVSLNSQRPIQKILNDDLQVYILLSTGQIKMISLNHGQLTTQKTYTYSTPNQDKNQQQKQWIDAQLYHKNGRLHIFIEQSFYFVSLNEIDNGKHKRIFYELYKLIEIGQVLKVVQTNQLLMIFTDNACYRINKNSEAQMVVEYSKIHSLFVENTKKVFIDFATFGNFIYFLHQQLGVIVYNSQNQQVKLLRIQHPQLAEGINVQNDTIMVTYEIAEEDYIQEYHFIEDKKIFIVNKVYTYHSQEPIGNILLFQQQIIISRGSQILHGLHSLSRKLPYAFHKQSQVLEFKYLNDEVIQLRQIWSQGWKLPGYMIATEKSIQLIEFQAHSGRGIQQKWVSISSETSGTLNFGIQFIGTCKNSSFYPPEYCSITKSVQLTFNDRVNQEITSWWLWVLIGVGCYLILCALFFIFCTYFSRKQNQFESLIESKKQRKQGSAVAEISFQTGAQNTEQSQK